MKRKPLLIFGIFDILRHFHASILLLLLFSLLSLLPRLLLLLCPPVSPLPLPFLLPPPLYVPTSLAPPTPSFFFLITGICLLVAIISIASNLASCT